MRFLGTFLMVLLCTGCGELQQFWEKEFVDVYAPGVSRDQKIREAANIFNYWLGQSKEERIRVMGKPEQCTALNTGEEMCAWTSKAPQRLTYSYNGGMATSWDYQGPLGQFTSANYQTPQSRQTPAGQAASPSSTGGSIQRKP